MEALSALFAFSVHMYFSGRKLKGPSGCGEFGGLREHESNSQGDERSIFSGFLASGL